MIRQLRLRNWRSYERLDLSLDAGTTFVVAPNGVGKTSLVLGLAWAVFGGDRESDPKSFIRAGAESAEAAVDLDLPDGREATITRSLKRRGSAKATFSIDGKSVPERTALAQLEQALGVELSVASRLATMLGGGHLAAEKELDLEAHLHYAFGVSHLLETATAADSVAKEATKARAAFRSSSTKRLVNRAAVESEIAELERELTRLEQRRAELEHLRDRAAEQRALVERQFAVADEMMRYQQRRSQLLAEATDLLSQPVVTGDNESVSSALRATLRQAEHATHDATDGIVAARSAIASADEAVGLLDCDDAICPTCMRPITADERDSAKARQLARRTDARQTADRLGAAREADQVRVNALSRLLTQFESLELPSVVAERSEFPDRAAAEGLLREAIDALDEHNREWGATRSRLDSLRREVASDNELQQDERELRLAYRREAVALASAQVLREAADHVIESRIEPIADELRWRWKRLFANEGLTLKPDGSIVRVVAGEELGWDTLSGGERTWARIVTHLLVLATTTRLPFAWFDEPLEHLDPQFRHTVAATLANATSRGAPRQLLVTTYEHTLAQQLADDTESAKIIRIRQSGS